MSRKNFVAPRPLARQIVRTDPDTGLHDFPAGRVFSPPPRVVPSRCYQLHLFGQYQWNVRGVPSRFMNAVQTCLYSLQNQAVLFSMSTPTRASSSAVSWRRPGRTSIFIDTTCTIVSFRRNADLLLLKDSG